ncbi:DNA polymerase I [Enhygromyxa salina]|uniref:DNA polymerase I n=1 Tax=Enhygromyxa salina TaxID=215803 RepID=A0A2S9XCR2_9BACT|nr:DNA polymerase I [Enhygromyxa salina]PRP90471.1 DNA polymerase I [Enhygromyxa salina]
MATPERLILIDASALIYRAYYAIPSNFTTADGLHTNAIYGFATMFRKILSGRQPERGAVVFDAPGQTFREKKYPEYKAQRPRMDPELREQLAWVDKLVEAHHFPHLRMPGYEADDVIGTLTRLAVEAGMEVYIISGDKDFAQLISDRVRMVDTLRDITFDPELVRKKWGVAPERFVDLLALMGDKVDNIPGIPGIGQKTATKLLDKYGDFDGIFAHVDELKGKQKERIEDHREQAALSRELATIDTKVPLELGLDDLKLVPVEAGALNELYKKLEFYSLLSETEAAKEQGADADADFAAVATLAELDALIASFPAADSGAVAVYPVYDAPSPVRGALAGLAFSFAANHARFVPTACAGGLGDAAIAKLAPWLEDPKRYKLGHDCKALWVALRRVGVTLRGVVGDTMLESFLIDPNKLIPHALGQVVKEYLQRTIPPTKRVLGSGKKLKQFTELTPAELFEWSGQQVEAIATAFPAIRERLDLEGHRDYLETVELPLSWVLGQMELDGVAVDSEDLAKMGEEFGERLATLEAKIFEIAGREFNIASPKQLGEVLFDELKLPVIKRTKTGYSTNAEVLERLAAKTELEGHEIAEHLLEHRKLAKLINTYTEVLQNAVNPETGRIHTTFQQTTGVSGRLITTEPDLQRTPVKTPEGRRIRQTFVARAGCKLISADWSQIELRLLAHFTGDEHLVDSFARGLDVHARTAGQLFEVAPDEVTPKQRGVGKLVNFATIYGQGATALSQILKVPRKQAQAYIDGYFEYYAGVRAWLDATIAQAHIDGYVETVLGRRRYIPELSSNNWQDRQYGERISANTPIQGSAADICKLAMLGIDRELKAAKLEARMLLQIHDELVFEAPVAELEQVMAIARAQMEQVYPLKVPLVVDVGVGTSWAEAH